MMKLQDGPTAVSRYGGVALLDTGSPQKILTAETRAQMKADGTATDACE